MALPQLLTWVNGALKAVLPTQIGGSAQAGNVVALNAAGVVDPSMLTLNIDGGDARAKFLSTQVMDGGNASSVYAAVASRTVTPAISNITSGQFSSIAANTAQSASVSVTAGTMLLCMFAQESTTANSNPAITSVTASGVTFSRLGSFIGVGGDGTNLTDAQSIEVWGAPIATSSSALTVSWEYNTAIDDATYSFEQVTNYGSVSFADTYTQAVTASQSITYSLPDYALAYGVGACAASEYPSLTGFTQLANPENNGATNYENTQTAYVSAGATPINNATSSSGLNDSGLILIGTILGT